MPTYKRLWRSLDFSSTAISLSNTFYKYTCRTNDIPISPSCTVMIVKRHKSRRVNSAYTYLYICISVRVHTSLCMSACACMMKSAHPGKAIMFTNGKMMSERLFEPLSSATRSIVQLWDYLQCPHLNLGLRLVHHSQINVCFCSRQLNRAVGWVKPPFGRT